VISRLGKWQRHARGGAGSLKGLFVGGIGFLIFAGCQADPFVEPPMPATCEASDALFEVFSSLDDVDNACRPWIDQTHGRVARSGNASAAVWSRRTQAGAALLVSAVHTLGVGWFGSANVEIDSALRDPSQEIGVARITFIASQGGELDSSRSPMFDFFNLSIPADQNSNFLRDILPRHDVFVAVVDDQKLPTSPLAPQPSPLQNASPDIYDPLEKTTTAPTFADVDAGELVMAIGFPAEGILAGEMAGSIGTVLSPEEIADVLGRLAVAGDEEGSIEYDPQAEFIYQGPAAGGMSGGGVFNASGDLVGVLVRASDPLDGVQYVRVVRMNYVVGELNDLFESLPQEQQDTIAPFLDTAP